MADIIGTTDGEVVIGTVNDDILTAAANNITLVGNAGNDSLSSDAGVDGTVMDGGPGIDFLIGNGTNDTASYASAPSGVTVDLAVGDLGIPGFFVGTASDGYVSGSDSLFNIENVTGSSFADSLTGSDVANVLEGDAGNDTLKGELGNDVFKYSFTLTPADGGGDSETFRFTDFFAAHGGTVVDGKVADDTKQGQFSSLYTEWLESLGLAVSDLGQNSGADGAPVVEGSDGTFGERESFSWTSGGGKKAVTHERWYSDTWTTTSESGGAQDTVASGDGFDTILDFTWGEDKLEFNGLNGLTLAQFTDLFTKSESDIDQDGNTDTFLGLTDGTWGVDLLGESGHTLDDFYNTSVFS